MREEDLFGRGVWVGRGASVGEGELGGGGQFGGSDRGALGRGYEDGGKVWIEI